MNKKQTIKKTAALLLGMAIAMGTTGCGFITTDSQKDLDQTVAEVKIQDVLKEENASLAEEFSAFNFTGEVKKRELISYYLSIGYQYVENYGYSYEDAFNMLLNALINREILGQEAAAYFLAKPGSSLSADGYEAFKAAELENASDEVDALLKKYEDVLRFKYFLTNGGTDSKEYDIAEYTLKKNINDSIDSLEASYIAEEEEHDHEETRTLPTGVDTEVEDYYVKDYKVYTGRNALDFVTDNDTGYEKVEGSTVASRQKAYNAFLTNLQEYNLVSATGKVENTSDVTKLEYYYVELASLLEQRLINNYYKALEEDTGIKLDEKYVKAQYDYMFTQNKRDYEKNPTAFATEMDSVAADSFLLYAPINKNTTSEGEEDMIFGYVYNILIPFSTSQSVSYTEAQNMGLSERELFNERSTIGAKVYAQDLRTSWISKHDHANYSNVLNEEYELGDPIYFFENNNGSKHEELTQYAGQYAFKGTVVEDGDDFKVTADKISIDDFIKDEFEGYINQLVGEGAASGDYTSAYQTAYESKNYYKVNEQTGKEEIDYNNFIYYEGKVNLGTDTKAADFFKKDENNKQYQALSAVNELMFAYSTDTGCLNTYMGYSVSPYGTNFVKEFEAAAQKVVAAGVGNYAVCLTDYGWHIVYCSFSYNADYMGNGETGDIYGGYNHEARNEEGTFSNLFYEYVKEAAYTNYTTEVQNKTLKKYDNETCITRYESRYKDLYNFEA